MIMSFKKAVAAWGGRICIFGGVAGSRTSETRCF